MNLTALRSRFKDATARIEESICIATAMTDDGALADRLESILTEGANLECLGMPGWVSSELEAGGRNCTDAFFEWATEVEKFGWLVQFASPVMTQHKTGATFSWGYYRTKWVYADTFAQAIEAGLTWVAQMREHERRTAGEAAGPVPA